MFKITWMQLAHPGFQSACQAIWDCPMLDAQTSFTAHRLKKLIDGQDDLVRQFRISLAKKYAKYDAEGKPILDPENNITFETEEKHKEYEAAFINGFNSREVEIKAKKLDFHALAQVRGITPRHWEFLEPIVDNLPVEEVAEAIEAEEAKEAAEATPAAIGG